MRLWLTIFSFLLIAQSNAQLSQKIDTTKNYKELIYRQLKGTLQHWDKHIVNYALTEIGVRSQVKIGDSSAFKKYYNQLIDTSNIVPLYSNNTKEVSFGSLGKAVFRNKEASRNASMYEQYKKMVKDSISIGNCILKVEFKLINKRDNTELVISEPIIYTDKHGLRFDNVLWWVHPMKFNLVQ